MSSVLLLVYLVCCAWSLVSCEWGPFSPVFGLVIGGCLLAGSEFGRWPFRRFGERSRVLGGLGGGCVVVVVHVGSQGSS